MKKAYISYEMKLMELYGSTHITLSKDYVYCKNF